MQAAQHSNQKFLLATPLLVCGWLLTGMACLLSLASQSFAADPSLEKYFAQLRSRQLYSLAESYALERLKRKPLSLEQQTQLTLELSRTYAAHARHTRGAEQTDLWQRADDVIGNLLSAHADLPNRRELQAQRAFLPAIQGEYYYWQHRLLPSDLDLKSQAITALSKAIQLLSKLQLELEQELRRDPSNPTSQPKRSRIQMLHGNVQLRLALAYLDRSQLSAHNSPEQIADLTKAEPLLTRLSGGKSDAEMTWRGRIALLRCLRLQDAKKPFAALVDKLENRKPKQRFRDKIQAEKSRLWLSLKEPTVGAQELLTYQREHGKLNTELQYLHLQMFQQLWQIAVDKQKPDLAEQIMQQMMTAGEDIQKTGDGYWAARAEQTLNQIKNHQKYGPQIAALLEEAHGLYAGRKYAAAVKAYQQAIARAQAAGKQEVISELAYTAASILVEQKQYRTALDMLKMIVEQNRQHKLAPDAHLLYAFCLGQLMQQKSDEQVRWHTAYAEVLTNHLEQFPNHQTTDEARWMLAQHLQQTARSQNDVTVYNQAVVQYLQIPQQHEHAAAAELAVAHCFADLLQILDRSQQPAAKWEQYALNQLDRIAKRYDTQTTTLTVSQAKVLLITARIRLRSQEESQRRLAVQTLQQIIAVANQRTDGDEQWRAIHDAALQLRVFALADRQPDQAIAALGKLAAQDALQVLKGLSLQAQQNQANVIRVHKDLAERLDLKRSGLNKSQQAELDRELARAYVNTGEIQKALRLYRQLVKREPEKVSLQQQYALLLTNCSQADCWQEAVTVWRQLERRENQGTIKWLECRYWVIHATLEQGDPAQAKKLLAVTQLLYPKLGNKKMRAMYEDLHARVNSK